MSCTCWAFPGNKKNQEAAAGKAPEEKLCAICYAPLRDTENESLPCGHTYHVYCINEFTKCRGVQKLDVPCPECKLVPSVLISESRGPGTEAGPSSQSVLEARQDAPVIVVDPHCSPVSLPDSTLDSVPETVPEKPARSSKKNNATSSKKTTATSSKKKPAGVAKQDVAKPEVAKSEVGAHDVARGSLFRFFSTSSLDDDSQGNTRGRKRLRAKTFDENFQQESAPATKKQKAAAEKEEGEAAQKDKSKKRKKDGENAEKEEGEAAQKNKAKKRKKDGENAEKEEGGAAETPLSMPSEVATAVAIEGASDVPVPTSTEKRCFFCNMPESQQLPKPFQVNSKRDGLTYKCQKCTSSRTYFYNSGDFNDIMKLTEEDRWKFFQSCKSANKGEQLELIRTLRTANIDDKIHSEGYSAKFHPEGVLKQGGYDVERIKANSLPEDMYEDPKLGWCYRVDIKEIGFKHERGTRNRDEYKGTDQPSSASNENISSKMKELFSTLSVSGKENSAASKKRIGLVEKEKNGLTKLKSEIKMYKVPKYMNVDAAFESMFSELDGLDHLDDAFDEKLSAFKEASNPTIKALKHFV